MTLTNKRRSVLAILVLLLLALAVSLAFQIRTVHADESEEYDEEDEYEEEDPEEFTSVYSLLKVKNNQTIIMTTGKADKKTAYGIGIDGLYGKLRVESISSSNAGVVRVRKTGKYLGKDQPYAAYGYFTVTPKKTGKTKLTIRTKSGVFTLHIKVIPFRSPFKTFTINGKNYKNKVNRMDNFFRLKGEKKVSVKYTLNAGWKIVKSYENFAGERFDDKLLNGTTKRLGRDGDWFGGVRLKNSKTGQEVVVLTIFNNEGD